MAGDEWDRRSRGDSPSYPPGPSSRESTSCLVVLLALLVLAVAVAYYLHWEARNRHPPPGAPVVEVVLR